MFVQFWSVRSATASPLAMEYDDVSKHLLVDWVPSLPVNVSSSFVGWPPYLLNTVSFNGYDALSIAGQAGRSERQWKGFLSWMLGVAGTRHVLKHYGYRWIAPLSAFYDETVQPVDLPDWPSVFKPGLLTANRPFGSTSRLRPDYLAIPSTGGQPKPVSDWAIAESKGTRRCLTNLRVCPRPWHRQARNIEVSVWGNQVAIPRHLVIATRVNPNAKRQVSRRIQVRAWNSADEITSSALPLEAALDVAAAHLFGFFRNVRLLENARAIAWASMRRSGVSHAESEPDTKDVAEQAALADAELREFGRSDRTKSGGTLISRESDAGRIDVTIAEPLIALTRMLQRSVNKDSAVAGLLETDRRLDAWQQERSEHDRGFVLPFGVEVRFSRQFRRDDRAR